MANGVRIVTENRESEDHGALASSAYSLVNMGWGEPGLVPDMDTALAKQEARYITLGSKKTYKAITSSEEMAGSTTRKGSKRTPLGCLHKRVTFLQGKIYYIKRYGRCTGFYTWKGKLYPNWEVVYLQATKICSPGTAITVGSCQPLLSDAALAPYRSRAAAAMQANIPQGFKGLLNLAELKDFKRVATLCVNGISAMAKYARYILRTQSKKQIAAGVYLTDSFAVQPTLRAMFDLDQAIGNYHRALDNYEQQGHQRSTHHYSEKISFSGVPSLSGDIVNYLEKDIVYCATAVVMYANASSYKRPDKWDYFGMSLTPSTVWDLIPFSFLIDHVFTVGATMDHMSRNVDPSSRMLSFCDSQKSTASYVTLNRFRGYNVDEVVSAKFDDAAQTSFAHPYHYVSAACKATIYSRAVPPIPSPAKIIWPEFRSPTSGTATTVGAMLTAAGKLEDNPLAYFSRHFR